MSACVRRAAIFISRISLLDVAFDIQVERCRAYCADRGLEVVMEVREYGYITEDTADSETWSAIVCSCISDVVFFRSRQMRAPAVAMFESLLERGLSDDMRFHFVDDNLVLEGVPPAFRSTAMDIGRETRKCVRDLVTLLHIGSCSRSVLLEFIKCNFGGVDQLLHILRSNMHWVSSMLGQYDGRVRDGGGRRDKKAADRPSRRTCVTRFRRFVAVVRRLRGHTDDVERLCDDMMTVSLF
ncbi:conserved hypothetical pox protein [Squirrelpox virus]|uniref:Protein OPG061 n=1 Tax=Squirrelpox virus TaxID=240426 RepID=Q1HTT1_9POXV|nr:conserved hypothetical pox protein [Squirrelpox virus]ABD51455.1 A13L [Squirrelpox virus]CCD83204.1 conserved hypothetical pox protein [Squirrelpox virus]